VTLAALVESGSAAVEGRLLNRHLLRHAIIRERIVLDRNERDVFEIPADAPPAPEKNQA
jgi:hypothetical protein